MGEEARQAANEYEPQQTLDRAVALAEWIEGLVDIVDPLLVSPAGLDPMVSPLRSAAQAVRSAAANPAEVPNVSAYLDQVFATSGPLVVATPAVRETASQVARGFGTALGHRTRALKQEADALVASLDATRTELDNLREQTTQADADRSHALQSRIEQLSATVDQMQARVDQLIATSTETFEASEKQRTRAFTGAEQERNAAAEEADKQRQDRFDEIAAEVQSKAMTATNKVREDAEALNEELKTETRETLDHIEVVRAKVDRLYGIISKEGTAGAFHDEAVAERKAADRWRRISLGFGAAAIVAAILSAFIINVDDTSWPHLIAKLAVTVGFGGVATYAGHQSSRHRHREEHAKQLELDLTAIGPFIEDMPEGDNTLRNEVRKQFVERWMTSRAIPAQADDKSVPLNVPIDRLVSALLSERNGSK
jgi:hypothetical protein